MMQASLSKSEGTLLANLTLMQIALSTDQFKCNLILTSAKKYFWIRTEKGIDSIVLFTICGYLWSSYWL